MPQLRQHHGWHGYAGWAAGGCLPSCLAARWRCWFDWFVHTPSSGSTNEPKPASPSRSCLAMDCSRRRGGGVGGSAACYVGVAWQRKHRCCGRSSSSSRGGGGSTGSGGGGGACHQQTSHAPTKSTTAAAAAPPRTRCRLVSLMPPCWCTFSPLRKMMKEGVTLTFLRGG